MRSFHKLLDLGITEFFLRRKSRRLRGETIGRVIGRGTASLLSNCGSYYPYTVIYCFSYLYMAGLLFVIICLQELVLF
jgi:hypothetical protein